MKHSSYLRLSLGVGILLTLSFFFPKLIFSQTVSPLAEKPYKNKQGGYQIRPPEGWSIKEDKDSVLFVSPSISSSVYPPNLLIIPESQTDLATHISEVKKILPQKVPGYQIMEEKSVTVNGKPAYLLSGIMTYQTLPLRNLQLYVYSHGTVYSITFTASEDLWPKYQQLFMESLMSFRM